MTCPKVVKCELFLYADDTCLTFQHENVKEIKDQLNLNLSSLCDWFIDYTLSIHLIEDKTNSILFGTKFSIKQAESLNIVYGNVLKILQVSQNDCVRFCLKLVLSTIGLCNGYQTTQ